MPDTTDAGDFSGVVAGREDMPPSHEVAEDAAAAPPSGSGGRGSRAAWSVVVGAMLLGGWGLWAGGPTPRPAPDGVTGSLGVDVSHHQGVIDWTALGSAADFAWIKATEGGDWTDPRFAGNWAAADAAGMRRGAYHFFTFCRSGADQAAHFLATVPVDPAALPPAVDLEYHGNCAKRPTRNELLTELRIFLTLVETHYGKRPVLYTTPISYWRFAAGAGLDVHHWRRDVSGTPRTPHAIWQYADDGTLPGVSGPVDMNLFRGPPSELDDL